MYPLTTAYRRLVCQVEVSILSILKSQAWFPSDTVLLVMQLS